ncbi:MAG: type I methionyl aminopeptidase [Candidatus Roizmanbacteria bacterium]
MPHIKTPQEIKIMRECGRRLRTVTSILIPSIHSGQTTLAIEEYATKLLREHEIEGSFKTVNGYKWNTCTPVNNQAVHTIPSSYVLQPGDLLTVDIGGLYQGYHSDWATSIIVDGVSDERKKKFLDAGRNALALTLSRLKVGEYLSIVGETMQNQIESAGYRILKDLTGHGIGRELHEDPYIPNYTTHHKKKGYRIEDGFVAAIEVIYSQTTEKIIQSDPKSWSIDTADGSLAACFEHTVLVTQNGIDILT